MSADAPSDAALVRAVVGGAPEAFEVLARRYARAAYLVALAATGEPADAEDAVQDALLQAYARLHECRTPDRFGAWLLRIVRNRSHNVRRHESLRRGEPLHDADGESPDRADARLEQRELRDALLVREVEIHDHMLRNG